MADVERAFVDNWGLLAETFGMQRDLGRIHALIYIAHDPVDEASIARQLDLPPSTTAAHVGELLDWGVVRASENAPIGAPRYVTERDPWGFFLQIVAERHRREYIPMLERMRETLQLLRSLQNTHPWDEPVRRSIEQFTRFVEELSSLIDLFVRLGAKPMALVLRTLGKLAPRAASP
jgi:DNA-binding transcriptional regulator GbsR (MarR family)